MQIFQVRIQLGLIRRGKRIDEEHACNIPDPYIYDGMMMMSDNENTKHTPHDPNLEYLLAFLFK